MQLSHDGPCPQCSTVKTKVIDTNTSVQNIRIRRRICLQCNHRWYTIQYPEVSVNDDKIKYQNRKMIFKASYS